MAHRSSAESHDQIPSKSLDLNTPHPSKDIINMEEQQQQQDPLFSLSKINRDGIDRDKGVTEEDPSASKSLLCEEEKMALQEAAKESSVTEGLEEDSGRERLKRHRVEVAGRVWIPDMWGQEELLKDWIDCTAFDAPLVPSRISTAREALVEECTRANAAGLRIENRDLDFNDLSLNNSTTVEVQNTPTFADTEKSI
ncbi:protein BIC1 isoform X1 [Vigna angularis]|uniref:protein BIC1 isoform X1 n=1 Tax=Phaseolus angularis TaxID=3914 RepID=UPI0008099F1C|nr:protein BIC1 isoform X1 [Vigna angularis]